MICICLSRPLSSCSVDYTSPCTISLPKWSTTLLLDCRSSSPSLVIPGLKLSLPHRPATWQSCFCPTLSGGSCFFLAAVDPQVGSYFRKKQICVIHASCTMPAGDLHYLSGPPQVLPFPSLVVFKEKTCGVRLDWCHCFAGLSSWPLSFYQGTQSIL